MDIQNSDWLTGGPWYNISICKKLHGKFFEGFIINERTDRYNIMCFIDAYEIEHQSSSCGDDSSGEGCPLPKNSNNVSIRIARFNHIFYWLLAKILRT